MNRTKETPIHWRFVGIWQEGNLYTLRGRYHSEGWHPGDLKALKLGKLKTEGLTLAEALRNGEMIDKAMCAIEDNKEEHAPGKRPGREKPPEAPLFKNVKHA